MPFKLAHTEPVAIWLRSLAPGPVEADLVVLALERALSRDEEFLHADTAVHGMVPPVYRFHPIGASMASRRRVLHVIDWIVASVRNDASWLKKVDAAGRPVKLTKLGSLTRAVAEADKAMRRMAAGRAGAVPGSGQEHWKDLDDGWSIVRLTTPEALDGESSAMQHCVGNGAYDDVLASEEHLFLSLRDSAGRPHVTLEVNGCALVQIRGKQNELPKRRYVDRLLPFLEELSGVGRELSDLGMIQARDGSIHHVSGLPDDLETAQSIGIVLDEDQTLRLPSDRLVVDGDITIVARLGNKVMMPRILHVGGRILLNGDFVFPEDADLMARDLQCGKGSIERLPPGTRIRDHIYLMDTEIGTLPSGLSAKSLRIVRGDLRELPSDLQVEKLNCLDVPLTSIPPGMHFDDLVVEDCRRLTSMPDDLTVEDDLLLRDLPISRLGARMKVGKKLTLIGLDHLEKLSEDLAVSHLRLWKMRVPAFPAELPHTLTLEDVGSFILPPDTRMRGSLTLKNAVPRVWPSSMRIGGTLSIECLAGISLPNGTVVDGNLILMGRGGSVQLGDRTQIGGACLVQGAGRVVFGAGTKVSGDLNLMSLREPFVLPADLLVEGRVNVDRCHDVGFAPGFGIGSLHFERCRGIRLPPLLDITGFVAAAKTEFVSMPDVMKVRDYVWFVSCTGVVLPQDVRIEGDATFDDCGLLTIGSDAHVGGDLMIQTSDLYLHRGLTVAGSMTGWGIVQVPDGANVGRFVGTERLSSMGEACHFGSIHLVDSPMTTLPSGMVVEDGVIIEGSSIRDLPNDLVVLGGRLVLTPEFEGRQLPAGVRVDEIQYLALAS
jgi:hypothetical protein